MKAYVCVYRHQFPCRRDWLLTESAAACNPRLRRFLNLYGGQDCFYDWGDDPSFFAASEFFGDVRYASWGVCRPDVRRHLEAGDYVVFFCAKSGGGPVREYFYIGVGTVSLDLTRQTIWLDKQYAKYRDFFNILARFSNGVLQQHESVYPYHDNWRERCKESYWLFDQEQSQFNLVSPLHVATYTGTKGAVETWHSSRDRQVAGLEAALFPRMASARRLRTRNYRMPHRHIDLQKHLGESANLNALRSRLMEFATGSL